MIDEQSDVVGRDEQRIARIIHAPADAIYQAITEPSLLVRWQTPGEMTARIEPFADGSGYWMILRYPDTEANGIGKSGEHEDRYSARYLERDPLRKVVQAIAFETDDPAFAGEMTMTIDLVSVDDGTEVAIAYRNLPSGIRPEDNELGTRLSLEKLAALVEDGRE
ncbi:MAG: SRPBCC domain-containing protein [Thermomicrobiales bacterium]